MELRCHGVGVCTVDAEMRPVGTTNVSTVNLAFNKNYKDKDGQWQQETSFVKVQIFGPRAEKFAQFAKKGVPIYAEGYVKQDNWTDKDGQKKTMLVLSLTNFEIVQKTNGEKKEESSGSEKAAASPPKNKQAKKSSPEPRPVTVPSEIEDGDEIPF